MPRNRYQSGSKPECENGVWYIRYYEKHVDGKRPRKRRRLGSREELPTKSAARKAAEDFMREQNQAPAVIRFSELCGEYISNGMGNLRPYTRTYYLPLLGRLRQAFGKERLDALTSPRGIALLESWLNGLRTGRGKAVRAATFISVA